MTYHEYTDHAGRLRRQHHNGHRFNQVEEVYTITLVDPNIEIVQALSNELRSIIGSQAFHQFYMRFFRADFVFSYAAVAESLEAELDQYECSCNPVDEPCSGCRLRARARYADLSSIPY